MPEISLETIQLAYAICQPFADNSAFEDYQREGRWTNAEYDTAIAEMRETLRASGALLADGSVVMHTYVHAMDEKGVDYCGNLRDEERGTRNEDEVTCPECREWIDDGEE
jgi:hypothetical protein